VTVLAFAGDFVDYSVQREECRKDSISIISQRMYNMKQISIIIALALLTTIANAQNISSSHEVRANDEVKKQQVEYAAVDSTGHGLDIYINNTSDIFFGTNKGVVYDF